MEFLGDGDAFFAEVLRVGGFARGQQQRCLASTVHPEQLPRVVPRVGALRILGERERNPQQRLAFDSCAILEDPPVENIDLWFDADAAAAFAHINMERGSPAFAELARARYVFVAFFLDKFSG